MTFLACDEERSVAIALRFVFVHAALDKQFCHLHMTLLTHDEHWGGTIAHRFVRVHAALDKQLCHV
jgi:hypothetical protein